MHWKSKIPRDFEKRVIKRFIVLPTLIEREWKWLETAYIYQEWNVGWNNISWISKSDYENKNSYYNL